ncbi:MAG: gliding motility lipoprotein GldD [Bacteroidetes bacterium]|nr:gliding motility lipoprotein GldD [Bacteroidota bacterium]
MKKNNILFFLFATVMIVLASCGGDEDDDTIAPKPRAYFRLSFPEKAYVQYDSSCPFSFEIPQYASISKDPNALAEPCWINVDYKPFNGTLHLSYKEVKGNVNGYLDDTYELASKHQVKASRIEEELIKIDSLKVYGLLYDIGGNAASSVQFFLTDSTKHFIRGALYFNAVPNTDSIKPVVDFIKKDIYHMINTFKWKN